MTYSGMDMLGNGRHRPYQAIKSKETVVWLVRNENYNKCNEGSFLQEAMIEKKIGSFQRDW